VDDDGRPIGEVGAAAGLSPRMLRYLEQQGVVAPERRPLPGPAADHPGPGHRHYSPSEVRIARAASEAMDRGVATGTLRALRGLAVSRVAAVRESGDPLAWFELLALARAVDTAAREDDEPSPRPPGRPPPPRPRR
jgi:hypothetical protein